MSRRAVYMYGAALNKGPAGQIGCGLGMTTSTGTSGLFPPTVDITRTGQEEVLDGVRIVFQLTPGTECPGRDELLLPRPAGAVHGRERHPQPPQPVTLRVPWSATPGYGPTYLDEAIDLFAGRHRRRVRLPPLADLGRANGWSSYLSLQRDLYAYLHDQTLRLMNTGLQRHRGRRGWSRCRRPSSGPGTPTATTARSATTSRHLPALPGLVRREPRPPVAAPTGRGLVPLRGRAWAEATPWWTLAAGYADNGDLRFAAELLDRVVFADPTMVPPGGAGRRLRAPGLRRRERDLAQLLPDGRPGTAQRHRRRPGDRGSAELLSAP